MPSHLVFLRRNFVLLSAYVTAQCILLEKLTPMYEMHYFFLLASSMCGIYLAVLWQQGDTFQMALEYEEVLQSSSPQLLEISRMSIPIVTVFALLSLFVTAALLAEMPFSSNPPLSFLLLLANMALQAKGMYEATAGRSKWRKPRLQNGEVYPMTVQQTPKTTERPRELSSARGKQSMMARHLTRILAAMAVCLAARSGKDVLHIRGELIDYGFNRGHLTYPACSQAYHNTLLLDTNVDSITMELTPGEYTHSIMMKFDSPHTGEGEFQSIPLNRSTQIQLPLPPSPLYSRVMLLALGAYAKTTYVIHVLRTVEAIELSLQSSFNTTQYPELKNPVFSEHRRLQYQRHHRQWYVPDLDLASNSTLRVNMTSAVLAPLTGDVADVPQIGNRCGCQPQEEGRGVSLTW